MASTDHPARQRRPPVLRIACATAVLFVAWFLAWLMAKSLNVSAPVPHADAVVVFSGSSTYVERAKLAATLYHQGRAPLIILTNDNHRGGWSNVEERNPYFVERAEAELHKANVPADKILVLSQPVSSTYEEAVLLRNYGLAHSSHDLVFVTSSYHSRRALWTLRQVFRGSGIDIGLESVPAGQQSPAPATWWLTLRGWRQVALEYPKLIYYWVRYR